MRKTRILLALLFAFVATVALALPAAAVEPACPSGWGSLPEQNVALTGDPVTGVRAGTHPCFDRVVVDIAGSPAGYTVQYVAQVTADGSGAVVPTPGGARLQATVNAPVGFTRTIGRSMVSVAGYPTLRSVVFAGGFEGYTSFGIGVRARLPFRVFTLPNRVVIDIAHHW
jgi:hypothetical protein